MKNRLQYNLVQRCGAAPGSSLLVGLSGGADSMALLHLLRELAADLSLDIRAAHLDHAIRPESAAEARFVERHCRSLGVPLDLRRVDVPQLAAQQRRNLEEMARDVRRSWLLETAAGSGALVVLAHHREDQAETVLQRLLRGSGSRGLGGMDWRRGSVIRPLLDFSRQELRDYLVARQVAWCEDASNADQALTRSRIRHRLLPQLAEFNPRIIERLNDLADQLRDEEACWTQLVSAEYHRLAAAEAGQIAFSVSDLAVLAPALRRRLLRQALSGLREDGLRGLEVRHLQALEGLLDGDRPQAGIDLPGCWAGRRYDRLILRRQAPKVHSQPELVLDRPGCYRLADGATLVVELTTAGCEETSRCVEFAADEVALPLRLRPVRPGDRFVPSGMTGRKKVKDFFIDARIDRETRQRTLVVAGEAILWLAGLRRCEGYRPAGTGERVLRLTLEPAENPTFDL